MSKVNITDTILRDAHQCLIATRMRTEDMLPICPELDAMGFWSLEAWGGATFDACLRFLKEDPWQRLRQLKAALPNTPIQMLIRGQNLLGYRHYSDDVVAAFVKLSAKNGVEVFRIFDALNDIRNLESCIKAVLDNGKHAQGTICYTTSPVHNNEQFIAMAQQLVELGCQSIAIKDMAGLLTPRATVDLFSSLKTAVNCPIHLHTHATAGLAMTCLYKAIEAGCSHVDTAISAFSEGASQACTESLVVALKDSEFDTGLDLNALEKIAEHFKQVRKRYHQFESDASRVDPRVHTYQVPGGMISNLHNQLREQNALDKINEVQQEIFAVRRDLGYPPLVTPTSQIVGSQAVLNVITGKRYGTITNEVKLYLQGRYGATPAPVDAKVRKQAIGNSAPIDCRPADLLKPELDELRAAIGDLAQNEEDLLIYAMFPDVGKTFLEERRDNCLTPEPLLDEITPEQSTNSPAPTEFQLTMHGEQYQVKIKGSGDQNHAKRNFYLSVDGIPEEVCIETFDYEQTANATSNTGRPRVSQKGHVAASMPCQIVDVLVSEGDHVEAGNVLFIASAMKMETEISAPISGKIKTVYVNKGEQVTPDDALLLIET